MDAKKRNALEAAGWRFGDAADLLGMDDAERQILEARVELALAIRRQREARSLSQKQLGAMLRTSQPRVARIEAAAPDVSMDQLVRAFTVAGGKLVIRSASKSSQQSAKLTLEVQATEPVKSPSRRPRARIEK